MFERFTEKALQAIMLAQEESRRLGHNFVGTEQIFLGIVGQGSGPGFDTLREAGVTLRNTRMEVERMIGRGSGFVAVEIPFTPRAKRVLEDSMQSAREFEHTYIGIEHLFLGLLEDTDGVATRVMLNLGVDLDRLRGEIFEYMGEDTRQVSFFEELDDDEPDDDDVFITNTLNEYVVNLTELAETNKLDPVIGRQKEIERVIQILSRRRKNNPILIGEPGVGKTAVAEGLAQRIMQQDDPYTLQEKKLKQIAISLHLAGTKYRGEFEDRLKRVIEEIEASEHLVVVIDEVHTLIGAGAAEGAMDAANTLKPALARGHFQCIGATTIEEYRQYIEKDKALERRFQPVYVNEPSVEETVEILKGLRQKYESYHNLTIEDSALMAAARMGSQYIADRYLPDKAIDLIDEASSRVRLLSYEIPEEAIELDRELRAMVFEKNEAVRLQNFELAIRLRNRENELRRQIATIIKAKKLQIDAAIEAEKVQAEKERLEKEQLADIPDPNLRNVVEEENKDKEILERFINPDPSDKKPDSDNMKSVTQSDFENDDEWEYQDELEPYIYNDDDNDLEDSMDEFKNFEKKTDENDKKESSEDSETKAQHSEKENILDEETFFNQYAERQLLISRDLFEEQLCKDDESDSNRVYDFDENGPGWEPLIEKSDDGDDTNYLDSFNDDDDDDFYKFNSFDRFINPFRR